MFKIYGKLDSLWGLVIPKIRSTLKKVSNKSCSESNFVRKSSRAYMSISHMSGARKFQRPVYLKSCYVQNREITQIHFGAQRCQKYTLHPKKLQIKVVRNGISYKKVSGHICLSSPRVELGGFSISVHYKISNVLIFGAPPSYSLGEIDICARVLFCTKFNSEQLLFEAFFDVMHIFGGVEPQNESNFPFLYIIRF